MLTLLGLLTVLSAAPDSLTYSGRDGQLTVHAPRVEHPSINVDGDLDEPEWATAAVLSGFTQYEPVEGVDPTDATEVRVFYSADAIYFGIHAHDTRPDQILARLGERDRAVFTDDWVRIMLDTYNDQRQAYVFYVNPLGIQVDGLWIEGFQRRGGGGGGGGGGGRGSGVSIDFNPNYIWESDGHLTGEGWTAEIRIPYVSMRFREVPKQDWGIQVARETRRNGFKQAWAPLTQEIASTLAQSGRLVGLEDLHARRLVEVNPVATGSRLGNDDSGTFLREDPTADFGMNGRLGVTQNLVLEGTYNPDFSQVEADAGQIAVNERFALFFPEKRAFFLEGAEIFNTPARLVYTRRIADPVAGSKLTGKVGAFQVGWIGAVDESPTTFDDGTGNAVFNLVRARRDVGSGSAVGLLYTDRTLTNGSGAYNRLLAADGRFVFAGRYTVTSQVAGSLTRDEDEVGHDGLQPLVAVDVQRSGRSFSWGANVTDVAPDFRARSGFITRAGDTEANANASFTRFGKPGAVLETMSLRVVTNNFFRHDDFRNGRRPFEHEVELWPSLSFRGGRTVTFVFRRGYFRFQSDDYEEYEVEEENGQLRPFQVPGALDGMYAWGLMPRMRINNALSVNGSMFFRQVPIFDEASRGMEVRLSPQVQYRPTTQLQMELNYTYSRISRRTTETRTFLQPSPASGAGTAVRTQEVTHLTPFSTVHIPRVRVQYQFNKALLARVVGQYELAKQEPLRHPISGRPLWIDGEEAGAFSTGEFQGQFLVQYEPSPGTIFYVGYSRLMEGARTLSLRRLDPVQEGLFVKLSYLFRL